MSKQVETHEYQPDSSVRDFHGRFLCTCGLPKANAHHDVEPLTEDQRELDARRVGEREPAKEID